MRLRQLIRGAGIVVGLTLLGWAVWPENPVPEPDQAAGDGKQLASADYEIPSQQGYVGSRRCAECHADIAATYATHPMARSLSVVSGPPPEAAGADPVVAGQTRLYTVTYDDQQAMRHHDQMFDAAGDLIYDQPVKMDYVVGSGRRAYAYLHQQGELLFQSPLNFYTQTGKWDLSPGYETDDPRRFRRRITDECLSCHAGRVATIEPASDQSPATLVSAESPVSDSQLRRPDRYQQPAFLEMSIGCERCHGPGQDHIAFHEGLTAAAGRPAQDPIVNPAVLPIPERESVCNQCHLQATARVLRYGRTDFDFRPGQNLEQIWTVLDAGVDVSADGTVRAVNHVQQMRSSVCYQASDSALGCISCHDPHQLPPADQKLQFYRQRCLQCHTSAGCSETAELRSAVQDSCVACHMPSRSSNNIAHVSQTDHRILRQPEASIQMPQLPSTAAGQGRGLGQRLTVFDEAQKRLPQWEADRATGLGVWAWLSRQGQQAPASLFQLLNPVLNVVPDDGVVLTQLAALAVQHQQLQLAREYFTRAAAIPMVEEAAVAGLVNYYYAAADWSQTLRFVQRALELDPTHAGFQAVKADALLNLGRVDEAIDSARQAQQLDPSLLPVQEWLVRVLEAHGSADELAAARQQLQRMQSATIPAKASSDDGAAQAESASTEPPEL